MTPTQGQVNPFFRRWCTCAFVIVLGVFVNFPSAAVAAELRILAVINDEPISAFDLHQRLNLIIRSSQLPDTPKSRKSLAPRVLRLLIDETLKLQEAKRLGITVSAKELARAKNQLEKQNRLPPGRLDAFLRSRGVSVVSMERQLKAAIAWPTLIRRRFARTVSISKDEVDKALARYQANATKPHVQLAEIFLAVDNPNEDARIRQNAARIVQELNNGADFSQLAHQFSQSASSARGGNLGWVHIAQLNPVVANSISSMAVNTLSAPIRGPNGYHIILLKGRRIGGPERAPEETVALHQIILPVPADAAPSAWESQQGLANTIRETAKGCTDFAGVAKELGSGLSGSLGRLKVSELPPKIRDLIGGLRTGVASKPERIQQGLRLIMVCDRSAAAAKTSLPDRDLVRRQLLAERLERIASRHLRDLRQNAFIDIRSPR